ncbi:uncharacterized protein TRIVIDRAFT_64161 [Trichoderma virens Gv29-8]|uniref:FAD-binding domain-containing protein n=1 Tax=Hypocrea virens (strain Gv29-8 / FGSC 10586) TaxID=413071 RepID=G9MND7_HYPVG|nr:uncharacterized protein TRIVIDRAFT_64161 [Trichoderma virens Gv29-8]EHK23393.1 hypothetical protein TRIVIDRAFT_64161 [Trichoderma virens Gv29-8]UKZ49694.1 hypothetical protein TrVGV298_003942 [Trichoderma virens]
MTTATVPHVIIIGSGITGLLIAQGLKKRGISYAIYDKVDPATRPRDWSMTIFWSFRHYPVLLPEELNSRIHEAQSKPYYRPTAVEELVVRNSETGEILKKVNSPYAMRVNRVGMRKLLLNGINVQYDRELIDIEYTTDGVIAHFKDGTSDKGTIIIGAEGGQSLIRRKLLGELAMPVAYPEVEMVNINVNYTHEQGKYIAENTAPHIDYGVHPKGIFFIIILRNVGDKDDYSTWTFHYVITYPKKLTGTPLKGKSNAERVSILRSLADDFAEPRQSALRWLPDDLEVPDDSVKMWSPVPWDNHDGRVTLAGDAAHAIAFYRGQGLNNATTDAAHLVSAIEKATAGEVTMADAITAYDKEVIARGQEEVALSQELAQSILDWEKFLESPIIKFGGNIPKEMSN